jgi:hypothetical protein
LSYTKKHDVHNQFQASDYVGYDFGIKSPTQYYKNSVSTSQKKRNVFPLQKMNFRAAVENNLGVSITENTD